MFYSIGPWLLRFEWILLQGLSPVPSANEIATDFYGIIESYEINQSSWSKGVKTNLKL
jgi:hypothetical protein